MERNKTWKEIVVKPLFFIDFFLKYFLTFLVKSSIILEDKNECSFEVIQNIYLYRIETPGVVANTWERRKKDANY